MSLIDRLLGRKPPDSEGRPASTPTPSSSTITAVGAPLTTPPDGSTGRFYMEIVGESYRQGALRKALKQSRTTDDRGRPVVPALVEAESNNQHDPMACRVITQRGDHIGYLSRERAAKFHNAILKVGGRVSCMAALQIWTREEDGVEQVAARIDLCDPWKIPGVKEGKG